jgi:hypothetical protein
MVCQIQYHGCRDHRLTSYRGPQLRHHRQSTRTSLPIPIPRPTLARSPRIRHFRIRGKGQARRESKSQQANLDDFKYLGTGQHDPSETGRVQCQ